MAVVLLVCQLYVVNSDFFSSRAHLEWGDAAANALQIERAGRLNETLGPYSRFMFHHPGPVAFYYLALGDELWRGIPTHLGRHYAMQLLVNGLWLLAIARLGGRIWGDAASSGILVGCVLFTTTPWPGAEWQLFRSIWGPDLVVLPTTVFLLASSVFARGDHRVAPLAALSGVVAVHTHLATGVVILPLGAIAAALHLRRRLTGSAKPGGGLYLGAAAFVLLVTSLPPLIEEFLPGEGNITRLFRFFSTDRSPHSMREILSTLGPSWTHPLHVHFPSHLGTGDPRDLGFQAAAILTLAGITGLTVGRVSRAARWMVSFLWGGLVLSFIGARGVEGPLYEFLFRYTFGLAGLVFASTILGLAAVVEAWSQRVAQWIRPTIAVLVLVPWFRSAVANPMALPEPDNTIETVLSALPSPTEAEPLHIDVEFAGRYHDLWPRMTGLVLHLERAGYDTCVDSTWDFMVAGEHDCDPNEARWVLSLRDDVAPEGPWHTLSLSDFTLGLKRCESAADAREFTNAFAGPRE